MPAPSLMWFRRDLRLADNQALTAAAARGPVVALYVFEDEAVTHPYAIGSAQRWWLHHSLAALDKAIGGKLLLRRGKAADVVRQVAGEIGVSEIHATFLYEPWEAATQEALSDIVTFHDGDTLVPPEAVTTGSGKPYRVYGPFWRALAGHLPPPEPLPAPKVEWAAPPEGDRLADWRLRPVRPDWAKAFSDEWTSGEAGAAARLDDFAADVGDYADRRDLPSVEGTSRLSPHLHMGEISPRQVWHALDRRRGAKFLKELAWRDFSRSSVLAQPDIGLENGRSTMDALPWRTGKTAGRDFIAWTKGRTGYPIVDAGMRQLWATGWMHNRVRMIAASFLAKHLLVDWRRGAIWFWDTLVDADYGNNALNWQWVAGTGTASQPFHRIMAPLVQSEKFDAADYIRRWVPELAHLDDTAIHDPPDDTRGDYPAKIVGHREGRERALAALAKVRVKADIARHG
jgi:deoxyribodipyrimidine photo-lyase